MNKKLMVLSVACFTFIVIIASLTLFLNKSKKNDGCSTTIIIYQDNSRFNLNLNFMYSLSTMTGVVAISGIYLENDTVKGKIRRDVIYNINENKDTYRFHSVKIQKFDNITPEPVTDAKLASALPDFYVYPDKDISYTITNQGEDGFMFVIGKRPLFFCSR
ncbi:hypothetical protein ACMYSP_24785 [Klebsiella sp. R390]|uniref:hypothetical protein n=1 Tax=Klebsiella sp. R390 TaxID=2755400 RepID=UPI003DA88087